MAGIVLSNGPNGMEKLTKDGSIAAFHGVVYYEMLLK